MNWIKVTPETMPPDGEEVIATVITFGGEIEVRYQIRRENAKWVWTCDNMYGGDIETYSDDEVTHWMPMIKPAED